MTQPRCTTHVDPRDWRDRPHPTRKDWIETTCRKCGVWIGNRPVDPKKGAQR